MFYKNNNVLPEGSSYKDMLDNAQGFLTEDADLSDLSLVGVSPVSGLRPASLMAMPVDSADTFSAVYFYNPDVGESVVGLTDLITGCNTYQQNFTLSVV